MTAEIFSHKVYKSLDDNVTCGEMADNDIIACFELPCHSQQSRSYKKQEDDPFIVYVYLSETAPARQRSHSAVQNFGYPFLVAITQEEATSIDAMYAVVVDRLQRWTTNVRDLHQWEGSSASTPMEEVPIPLAPTASLTEIMENGEVVTVHEVALEEGDIVDEKSVVMEDRADSPHDSTPRRVGFKRDLFTFGVQPSTQFSSGFGHNGQRFETWEQRIERCKDQDTNILLREQDTLICEFDENVRAYFFGDKKDQDHATWTKWGEFVHPEYSASRDAATQQKKRGITLQDCLDEFTKEEQLGEDDLWYCPSCKKHQQATKRFDLWRVPDVLVVHLKRFSNNRSLRDKIDTLVDFPLTGLDLTHMAGDRQVAKQLIKQGEDIEGLGLHDVQEPLIYDLYGVDEHIGGLGGGHYRAYAYNHADEKWYHFDDSYVSEAQASSSVVCLFDVSSTAETNISYRMPMPTCCSTDDVLPDLWAAQVIRRSKQLDSRPRARPQNNWTLLWTLIHSLRLSCPRPLSTHPTHRARRTNRRTLGRRRSSALIGCHLPKRSPHPRRRRRPWKIRLLLKTPSTIQSSNRPVWMQSRCQEGSRSS